MKSMRWRSDADKERRKENAVMTTSREKDGDIQKESCKGAEGMGVEEE